jgi:uncharacterized damage-inducible protein DinB
MLKHFRLLSRYKQWMNDKLYNPVAQSAADANLPERSLRFFRLITGHTLNHKLLYRSMKGLSIGLNLRRLILHFFTHQTHHSSQATALLSQ